jgi:hypothetical protein
MKLKSSHETDVYLGPGSFINIRQFHLNGEGVEVVRLNPEQAKALADELLRLVATKDQWWSPVVLPTDAPDF